MPLTRFVEATGIPYRQMAGNWPSVDMWAAIADGATDAAPSIQSAIDAIASSGRGGTLWVPPGEYLLGDTLSLSPGVSIRGIQRGNVGDSTYFYSGAVFRCAHEGNALQLIGTTTGDTADEANVHLSDFLIWGDKATYSTGHGIYLFRVAGVRLDNVVVRGVPEDGFRIGDGVALYPTYHNYLTKCYVNNVGRDAYSVNGWWTRLEDCSCDGGRYGIYGGLGGTHSHFIRCHLEGCQQGIHLDTAWTCEIQSCKILKGLTTAVQECGIYLASLVENTEITNCFLDGENEVGFVGISDNTNKQTTIRDCRIFGWETGISSYSLQGSIDGCLFDGCGVALDVQNQGLQISGAVIKNTVGTYSASIAGPYHQIHNCQSDKDWQLQVTATEYEIDGNNFGLYDASNVAIDYSFITRRKKNHRAPLTFSDLPALHLYGAYFAGHNSHIAQLSNNLETTDFSTYSVPGSAAGSWTIHMEATEVAQEATEASYRLYYRAAGAASGIGTEFIRVTNTGEFKCYGPLSPQNTAAKIYSGTGDPNGAVTASDGSLFLRTNPTASADTVYVKTGGTSNTGWIAMGAGFWTVVDSDTIGTVYRLVVADASNSRAVGITVTPTTHGDQATTPVFASANFSVNYTGKTSVDSLGVGAAAPASSGDATLAGTVILSAQTADSILGTTASKQVQSLSAAGMRTFMDVYTKGENDSLIAAAVAGLITMSHQHTVSGDTGNESFAGDPHHHAITLTSSTGF